MTNQSDSTTSFPPGGPVPSSVWKRYEPGIWLGFVTVGVFTFFGKSWLGDLQQLNPSITLGLFLWLFVIMLWSSFRVVHHAEALAELLGEPFGTLILTLSVISIEVVMVVAVTLAGKSNPELGRDMMFAVLMIVCNGLLGIVLLAGGLKHRQQEFNTTGARAYLAVLMPLAVFTLILPLFTKTTKPGTLSEEQAIFMIAISIMLYGIFLAIQTTVHRSFFMQPASKKKQEADSADKHQQYHHAEHPIWLHAILLIAPMVVIVMLSKSLGGIIDYGISYVGIPAALGGILLALLVLLPEGLAAVKAAWSNQVQRSVNICLGSGLATIGLTVPAVLGIGYFTGQEVVLGLQPVDAILLVTTLALCVINFTTGRTNILQGAVHLVVFLAYIMMIFD